MHPLQAATNCSPRKHKGVYMSHSSTDFTLGGMNELKNSPSIAGMSLPQLLEVFGSERPGAALAEALGEKRPFMYWSPEIVYEFKYEPGKARSGFWSVAADLEEYGLTYRNCPDCGNAAWLPGKRLHIPFDTDFVQIDDQLMIKANEQGIVTRVATPYDGNNYCPGAAD